MKFSLSLLLLRVFCIIIFLQDEKNKTNVEKSEKSESISISIFKLVIMCVCAFLLLEKNYVAEISNPMKEEKTQQHQFLTWLI